MPDSVTPAEPDTQDKEEVEEESSVIIVEDGTCVAEANSYVTLEEAIKYQTDRNRTDWLELDEEAQIASILRGTQYVDSIYNWKGRRKYKEQLLAFPRVMLIDLDGFPVEGIPQRLKYAILEATYYLSLADADETATDAGPIKRQKVDVVEVEYFENKSSEDESAEDDTSKYKTLNRLLRGLYFPRRWKGGIGTRCIWTGI